MNESATMNPVASVILLLVLLFIVYRILQAINIQNQPHEHTGLDSDLTKENVTNIFHLPESRPAPTPASLTLNRIDEDAADPFADSDLAKEAADVLVEKTGFNKLGDFTVEEMSGYSLRVFSHPEQALVAVLYLDSKGDSWINLLTEYEDGRLITSSSADREKFSGDRPRGMPLFTYPDIPLTQILRRHKLETRAARKATPVDMERFPAFYNDNYNRLRDHLNRKEEKRESVDKLDAFKKPPRPVRSVEEEVDLGFLSNDEKSENVTNDDAQEPSANQLRAWLKSIYKAVDVPKENRSQFTKGLVWVLEKAPMQSVADTIRDRAGVEVVEVEDGRWVIGKDDIIEPGTLTGPSLFDKVNDSLPKSAKFSKIPVSFDGVAFYSYAESE